MSVRDEIKEDLREFSGAIEKRIDGISASIEKRIDGMDAKLDALRTDTIPDLQSKVAVESARGRWNGSVFGFAAGIIGAVVVAVILSALGISHESTAHASHGSENLSALEESP